MSTAIFNSLNTETLQNHTTGVVCDYHPKKELYSLSLGKYLKHFCLGKLQESVMELLEKFLR